MTSVHNLPVIHSSLLRGVLYFVRSKGIDIRGLCDELAISQAVLENPEGEIEMSTFNAVWERSTKLTNDPYIGLHIGQAHDPGAIGIVAYLLQSSKTLGEAINNLCRYHSLISDVLRITSDIQSEELRIGFTPDELSLKAFPWGTKQFVETAMAFAVKVFPNLARKDIAPRRVTFTLPPPEDSKEYDAVFGTRAMFNQRENVIVYNEIIGTHPITSSNPSILALFENHANGLLKRLQNRDNVSSKTEAIVMKYIREGNLTIQRVASELFMTRRTLQRRLGEEGTTYQSLIDRVRANLACNYLRNLQLSGMDTAYLLGFSETSAFVKSFRRWTGMSPTEYKAAHPRDQEPGSEKGQT